jgi:hypothetical protein
MPSDSGVVIGVMIAVWLIRELLPPLAKFLQSRGKAGQTVIAGSADASGAHAPVLSEAMQVVRELSGVRERLGVVESKVELLLKAVRRLEDQSMPG